MSSQVFDQLIAARGFGEDFLCPQYEQCLDPFLLPDMKQAVERIKTAVQRGEKCLIYGDYDVDGVTASTALYDTLTLAGIKEIEIMLPNRFTDGYGMSTKVVQKVDADQINLVFTVDCGSRNHEIVSELKARQIDTVITDHHECGATLPEAVAVVNPKRHDVEIAADLRNLAGVGVVFKLAQALVTAGLIPAGQEKWLLDLVAIGTICDSMMLTGENRRLCHYGLMVLEKTRRLGLKALMLNAGVNHLGGDTVGFQIGPRLNAAGRMDTAERALNLLMANRRTVAAQLAAELERLNAERKKQQNAAITEIERRGLDDEPVIVEQGEWHEGVLGIIAGRLTEEYHRPAFALTRVDDGIKGSGRSFGDFNLAAALDTCREYITGGGGHAGACGVTLRADGLAAFRQALNTYYKSLNLRDQERFIAVREDLTVSDFSNLSLELIEDLKKLEPFGEGNQVPIFRLPDVRVMEVAHLGAKGQHLRLVVWDQHDQPFKMMKFNAPADYLHLQGGDVLDAWVTLEENSFRGIRSVEGRVVKLAW